MTHDTAALLAALVRADRASAKADTARKAAQAAYMAACAAEGITTLTVAMGNSVATGTVVTGSRTTYSVPDAQANLSPAMVRKITRLTVDAASVKALVTMGTLDADTVATFATVKPTAPYVRLS